MVLFGRFRAQVVLLDVIAPGGSHDNVVHDQCARSHSDKHARARAHRQHRLRLKRL